MNLLSNVIIPLIVFGNIILRKKYKFEYHQIFTPLLKIFYIFLAYIMLKKLLYRLERALFNFIYFNDIINYGFSDYDNRIENKGCEDTINYMKYLNYDAIKLINQVYLKDFELFDYKII